MVRWICWRVLLANVNVNVVNTWVLSIPIIIRSVPVRSKMSVQSSPAIVRQAFVLLASVARIINCPTIPSDLIFVVN